MQYETLKKKIQRYPSLFKIENVPAETGGKDLILVYLSSLSPKARQAYKAQTKVDVIDTTIDKDEIPWYVTVDLNGYIANNSKHYYKSVELSRKIALYLAQTKDLAHGEKGMFSTKMAKMLDMSNRTFLRNVEDYLRAAAWAERKLKETGANYDYFKILALARAPREKNNFIALTAEMKVLIENIKFSDLVSVNQWKVKKIHRTFIEMAIEKGMVESEELLPSYQTVHRYIGFLKKEHAGAEFLAAKGKKEFNRFYLEKHKRDLQALQVLEVAMGDGHTFDCWVTIKRPNGTVDCIRPHVLAWIDLRTRCLLGWVICEVPDAQAVKQSIANMIYQKADERLPGGVPQFLYIDNGKEYTAECLTGRPRKERTTLDADAKGFIRSCGIEDDIRAKPYFSSSKAEIERFFGFVCEDFSKESNTYVGTLTGSKTGAKIQKNINKMMEKGLVESIEAFAKRFTDWVIKYHTTWKHSGLKDQGESIIIPLDLFNAAEKYYKPAPPIEFKEQLLMKTTERLVNQTGIKMFGGVCYTHELLSKYRNQKVLVRYDPNDVSTLYVYDKDTQNKICEAQSYELLKISPKSNEKALTEHLKSQNRQRKQTVGELDYLRLTYEERQTIDLSEGRKVIAPELKGTNQKVVALPQDKQFRDDMKDKKNKAESREPLPDFYVRQAEKYLQRIQNG